jgi:hypothetical protein
MPPTKKAADEVVTLKPLVKETVHIEIIGQSPLIMHRWAKKAREEMLHKQMGTATPKKAPKDPVQDYEDSLYRMPDHGYGFPAAAFRSAIIDAARDFQHVTMTGLLRSVFVLGEGPEQLVRIVGEPVPREDMVNIGAAGKKVADIRFRAMFPEWSAVIPVRFLPSQITQEGLYALVDAAGSGGIGEWRPGKSKTGSFGTWEVSP